MAKTSGNESVKEGDSVTLTCSNGCDSGGLPSFTWLRDGRPVGEGPVLRLANVSHTDSGNYSCSLDAQRRPASEVITIDAEREYWTQKATLQTKLHRDNESVLWLLY